MADGSKVKRAETILLDILVFFLGNDRKTFHGRKRMEVMKSDRTFLIGTDMISDLFPGNEMNNYFTPASAITGPPTLCYSRPYKPQARLKRDFKRQILSAI